MPSVADMWPTAARLQEPLPVTLDVPSARLDGIRRRGYADASRRWTRPSIVAMINPPTDFPAFRQGRADHGRRSRRGHRAGAHGCPHESRGLERDACQRSRGLLQPERGRLWRKGEESGNSQLVREIYVDCDADAVLLKVEQIGGAACHEGYKSCFFRQVTPDGLKIVAERVFDPAKCIGSSGSKV